MSRLPSLFSLALLATPAMADAPRVVADITPVATLIQEVMGDLGEVGIVIAAGQDPHDYSMRPAEASLLEQADLVFWIGEALAPVLEDPIETLASEAEVVELMGLPGLFELERREDFSTVAGGDDHDHGDDDHDDHEDEDHDDHGDEDHDDHGDEHAEDDHDDHDEDKEEVAGDDHDHDHDHTDGADAHIWLHPTNVALILDVAAEELSALDAENAETYRANADAAKAAVAESFAAAQETLAAASEVPIAVAHDSLLYFEEATGLTVVGSLSVSDTRRPTPEQVQEVAEAMQRLSVGCFLMEVGGADPSGYLQDLEEAPTITAIDIFGGDGGSYADLIDGLAADISDCAASAG